MKALWAVFWGLVVTVLAAGFIGLFVVSGLAVLF